MFKKIYILKIIIKENVKIYAKHFGQLNNLCKSLCTRFPVRKKASNTERRYFLLI